MVRAHPHNPMWLSNQHISRLVPLLCQTLTITTPFARGQEHRSDCTAAFLERNSKSANATREDWLRTEAE